MLQYSAFFLYIAAQTVFLYFPLFKNYNRSYMITFLLISFVCTHILTLSAWIYLDRTPAFYWRDFWLFLVTIVWLPWVLAPLELAAILYIALTQRVVGPIVLGISCTVLSAIVFKSLDRL